MYNRLPGRPTCQGIATMSDEPQPEQREIAADDEGIAELARAVEAVLFAAPEPQTLEALRKGLGASAVRLDAALDRLAATLREDRRGIRLQRLNNQAQLVT